jgi:two-component system, chemotaxis family, chemotaxis protein CheY
VIEYALNHSGYDVITAIDGEDALQKFDGKDIELLIADVLMPKINGIDLISKVRSIEKYKNIPIIVISTENNQQLINKANDIGITAWLHKPFIIDKFLLIVKKALK